MRISSGIAELLFEKGNRTGDGYASFTLPSGVMLVIPRRGFGRRGGLALYNPQRAIGHAAKALMRTGLWPGENTNAPAAPLDELRGILSDLIGETCAQWAFQFGATGIYSKAVILAMDRAGRPLAYGKLAALPAAQQAVLHEASVLNRLSAVTSLHGRIPRVLGQSRWRGFPLLALSAGPSAPAPKVFGAAHREFVASLKDATRSRGTLLESLMWHDMGRLLATWRGRLTPAWCDRYDWALDELERRLGPVRLDLALAHRDFVCWNTRMNSDGSLFVFDWEFSRQGSMPGWDFFHFHVAPWAMLSRPFDRDGAAKLISAAQREGIEPADDLLLAYLTDIALFHHNAVLSEGGMEHREFGIATQGIDLLRALKSR
jgi:hypothetical protein